MQLTNQRNCNNFEHTNYLVSVESVILLRSLISVLHAPATVQPFKTGLEDEEAQFLKKPLKHIKEVKHS